MPHAARLARVIIREHLFEHFGQVEFARVDDDCVFGDGKRRIFARDVAFVAFVDLGERLFVGADAAFCGVFVEAAAGTGFGFGGEKEFKIRVRKNDAADIAALEHAAFRVPIRRSCRWCSTMNVRTSEIVETTEAACATSSVRISAETSSAVEQDLQRIGFADKLDCGVFGNIDDHFPYRRTRRRARRPDATARYIAPVSR